MKCSDKLTSAQELESVSQWQESSPEDSSLEDCVNETNTAAISSVVASPKSQSTPTCSNSHLEQQTQISLPPPHHASPSQSKANDWVAPIDEIAYPPSCDKLEKVSQNSSVSKTCLDCYQPPLIRSPNPEHISNRCSGSFGQVGTMRNGLLSEQPNTIRSGQVKGSCLLPRPGALSWSGKGRPPGTTKSEAKAKKLGILQKNEVYNPEWLEIQFGLPVGWTSPQEHRAVMELLATVEQHSETASTPDLQRSLSNESSISTRSVAKKSDCWYTPAHIVEKVVQVLGQIDLDPCADDGKHIPAQLHYTMMDDGLKHQWQGRVFINPPYSCPGVWMKKLQSEVESGRVREAITLVPAATDTNWLSPVLETQPVCFWKGRIKFLDVNYQPKLPARQSHCLVYWGENWERFREVFDGYGFVSVPNQFLGDKPTERISPRKTPEPIQNGDNLDIQISTIPGGTSQFLGDKLDEQISPRKIRRLKGDGSGSIHYRTVTKKGKDYHEAYYHYEFWSGGDRLIKSSRYIPKKLLAQVQQLEVEKAPVREILGVLRVNL